MTLFCSGALVLCLSLPLPPWLLGFISYFICFLSYIYIYMCAHIYTYMYVYMYVHLPLRFPSVSAASSRALCSLGGSRAVTRLIRLYLSTSLPSLFLWATLAAPRLILSLFKTLICSNPNWTLYLKRLQCLSENTQKCKTDVLFCDSACCFCISKLISDEI